MPLCHYCLQVVEKERPLINIANRRPTVDHYGRFDLLQRSSENCQLCEAILGSLEHKGHLGENPEKAFRGLKLRVEVDHNYCSPHQSHPPSSNDISAWGLRAYWVREESSTMLTLCKDLGELSACYLIELQQKGRNHQ